MKKFSLVFGLILFSLVLGIVSAGDNPDVIVMNHFAINWPVANGASTVPVTVTVMNETDENVIPGIWVKFIDSPDLGSFSPEVTTTNAAGVASSTFFVGTESGDTNLSCQVYYIQDDIVGNAEIPLHIDHGAPWDKDLNYENEVPVGTNTSITVHLKDYYGNPIDNRNTGQTSHETVIFTLLGSPGDNVGFWDDGVLVNQIEGSVDADGNVTVEFFVDTVPGNNIIFIEPQSSVVDETITILGTATGIPTMIDQKVNPTVLYQPNDNIHKFSLAYTLFDEFGNRQNGKIIDLHVTGYGDPEDYVIETAWDGTAVFTYGPSSVVKTVDVTAISRDDSNVSASISLEFYDKRPVNLALSAIPSTIPSKDVGSNSTSSLYAKVTDEKGKGVSDEWVDFILQHGTPYPSEQVAMPYLGDHMNTSSIKTDSYGLAIGTFSPGEFSLAGDPNVTYNPISSANATVQAKWWCEKYSEYKYDNASLEWKNFPFLSIYTSVSNFSAEVGDVVDVTIQLKGEGLAVKYREPMDVVLATSRAYSMLEESPDRMTYAYIAENAFIDRLMESRPLGGRDHIGLLTSGGNPLNEGIQGGVANILDIEKQFKKLAGDDTTEADDTIYVNTNYIGNGEISYEDWVTWEEQFTSELGIIKNAIPKTTPWDSKKFSNKPSNPLRKSVYESITALRNETNSIKAIVLLVDSEITFYGDLLAEGSPSYTPYKLNGGTNQYTPFLGPTNHPNYPWNEDSTIEPLQNMANYAQSEGVKVYVVYAASQVNNADWTTLSTLATQSGGAIVRAQNAAELESWYTWIADKLIEEAAIDTTMNVDMGVIQVNGAPIEQSGSPVFEYVHVDNVSTRIKNYYTNGTVVSDETINQTDDYNDDYKLEFYVGTINIQQVWEATYRLKLLVEGNIDLFGDESVINFTNPLLGGDSTISTDLGNLFLTSNPVQDVKTPTYDLTINSFECTNCEYNNAINKWEVKENTINLAWDIDYTGIADHPLNNRIYIKNMDKSGSWKQITARRGENGNVKISTWNLEKGNYSFRLVSSAEYAPTKTKDTIHLFIDKKPFFILLQ